MEEPVYYVEDEEPVCNEDVDSSFPVRCDCCFGYAIHGGSVAY